MTDWSRGRSIYHFILSIIPINKNDDAPPPYLSPPKHHWPTSMDWREVRLDIANDLVYWNALLLNLIDWNWGRPILHIILPTIPIKEKAFAPLKQFWPMSIDWREVRLDISNDLVFWNALLFNLIDWSWGRSILHIILSQSYQSRRRRLLHWNTQHQTQWMEEKSD